jgi:hypothetical protein
MDPVEYPALFRAAESASSAAQTMHLRSIQVFAALSILGAGLAVFGIESRWSALLAAVLFIGALFVSIFMAVRKLESVWYRARAVAESIKTSSWRLMMRAEPFDQPEILVVKAEFRNLLRRVLQEHKDLAHDFAGCTADTDQISPRMLAVRDLPLSERLEFYREHRIDEQRSWYARKAALNSRGGRFWFWTLVTCQAAAICFALLRVAEPDMRYWPTEIFVVAAGSALSWTQAKRFRELSAAYSLAAHEIGLARNELDDIRGEDQFSRFVSNSENAFSREHTQWAARKD